jgi:hypothetical protein
VARCHDQFNGSGDIAIPLVGGFWLMRVDVEQIRPLWVPTKLREGVDDELGHLYHV